MMEVMQEENASGAKKEEVNVEALNIPSSEEKVKTMIAIPSVNTKASDF